MGKARPRRSPRPHLTFAFRMGEHKVHMSLSRYADGKPMELWIDVHKEGSAIRALLNAIARLVSRAWQKGESVEDVANQFIGTKFEPAGYVTSGPACVEGRNCTSMLDAIGRIIDAELNSSRVTNKFDKEERHA